jgi:multicomponent Na+:H+ antiporter subunit F
MSVMAGLTYAILALALLFAVLRLLRGPSVADRIVALELIASVTVGIIAAYAVFERVESALDVALVLALTAFLAAIALSRYLERRGDEQ